MLRARKLQGVRWDNLSGVAPRPIGCVVAGAMADPSLCFRVPGAEMPDVFRIGGMRGGQIAMVAGVPVREEGWWVGRLPRSVSKNAKIYGRW